MKWRGLLLFFCIFALTGCNMALDTKDDITFEFGESISLNAKDYLILDNQENAQEIIDNTRVQVINDKKVGNQNYQPVGEYEVQLTYKYEKEIVKVTIQDTTKPEFIDCKETISIYQGETIDFEKLFTIKDLSQTSLTVDDSKLNTQDIGNYEVKLIAQDEYQNKNEKLVKVVVKKPELIIEQKDITMYQGDEKTLKTTVKGKDKLANFSSSDEKVVTVSKDGQLKAKSKGTSTITIKANGIEKTCRVTVKEKVISDNTFVRIKDYIPSIYVDLKYATKDNFTHKVIYDFNEAYLRYGTVKKLKRVQDSLLDQGYSLKIWDAYRPFSAQKTLWNVVSNPVYVGDPRKGPRGHNIGGTVDITLVKKDGRDIPMPTDFDNFSKKADRNYSDISRKEAVKNVKKLEKAMKENSFKPYFNKWGHYTDSISYNYINFEVE